MPDVNHMHRTVLEGYLQNIWITIFCDLSGRRGQYLGCTFTAKRELPLQVSDNGLA